ncbi:MAG: hypothetical protein U5R31_13320 [Acidimicrobiia bacterium]|nr:hypothetical protein [Acidimicrobiia bacterium]
MPRSPRPPEPPEFFVDRSLGRHLLPNALRDAGHVAHTLASVYGEQRAQQVADEEWIQLAGKNAWVVLTKDDAIRRRPAELAAVQRHDVRMFCLTTASLTGEQQRERFLSNINRIAQRSRKHGPWICGVYEERIVQIWPRSAG